MEVRPRIAVVDDLPEDRERLNAWIRGWFDTSPYWLEELREYAGGVDLLRHFEPGRFHAVFLDICMDQLNGIETARQLRSMDTQALLIFVTTSQEYAFDAFPLHPFDYLVKPVNPDKLHGLLREMMRVLDSDAHKTLTVRTGRSDLQLPLALLTAAVAQGHTVELHLADRQTLQCTMAFHELEEKLRGESRFITCNRGILINMDQVSALRGDDFVMKDGARYPLRVRGRAAVINAFTQYQFSKMHKEANP